MSQGGQLHHTSRQCKQNRIESNSADQTKVFALGQTEQSSMVLCRCLRHTKVSKKELDTLIGL